jgi:hypothetical protein
MLHDLLCSVEQNKRPCAVCLRVCGHLTDAELLRLTAVSRALFSCASADAMWMRRCAAHRVLTLRSPKPTAMLRRYEERFGASSPRGRPPRIHSLDARSADSHAHADGHRVGVGFTRPSTSSAVERGTGTITAAVVGARGVQRIKASSVRRLHMLTHARPHILHAHACAHTIRRSRRSGRHPTCI